MGEYKYNTTLSLTSDLGRGWSSTRRSGRFTHEKETLLSILEEAVWAPRTVWTGAEILPTPGFNPRTAQPIASRYTVYAIPAHVALTQQHKL